MKQLHDIADRLQAHGQRSGHSETTNAARELRTLADHLSPLRVGDMLYGYCNGYFGDYYGNARVEAIGSDWVVVRTENGHPMCTDVSLDPEYLTQFRTPKEET